MLGPKSKTLTERKKPITMRSDFSDSATTRNSYRGKMYTHIHNCRSSIQIQSRKPM